METSYSNIGIKQETECVQEEACHELSAFRSLGLDLDLDSDARLDVDLSHQAFGRSRAESIEEEEHHAVLGLLVDHIDVIFLKPLHQGCWICDLSGHSR